MFTGIITDLGSVLAIEKAGFWRLRLSTSYPVQSIDLGASIACNGICLSVVAKESGWMEFDAGEETLNVTTLKDWAIGDPINLERPLRIGDELGGHIVTGHIDGMGIVMRREMSKGTLLLDIEVPEKLAYFIAEKGSITVNGVSLTVNKVKDRIFSIGLIPITQERTNLSQLLEGSRTNLEIDVLARYVARLREEPR